MIPYIIDSSVAIKWLIPEADSPEAFRLQGLPNDKHTVAFIDVEIGSSLWKKVRKALITEAEANTARALSKTIMLIRHDESKHVDRAFEIAIRTGRTIYDCLYVALAESLNGQVVTADEKLVNGLANTPWAAFVMHLQSIP